MSVPAGPTGVHGSLDDEREVLGKYRLLAKLGEGGMANVHLAVASGPVGFHKLLVVKQVRTALVDEPDVLEMFFDEARLAARLNHPNVVQTLEVNATPEGWPFIAMEYLDGQPFHRILGRLGVGPTRYANLPLYVRTIAEACEGLHYAHELSDYNGAPLNIVHRDVSPHNIFVTYEGQVKLVDFGVAKAVTSAALTRTGALKGKVPYMAPEQASGAEVDRRADVFAMGVVLWNVLSDTRLWQGLSELVVLQHLVGGRIPSADEALPTAPAELRAVVNRALAVRPRDRYQTAAEMRRDLEKYLQGTGASLTPREVGDYIATYFAEERASLRALVDARLREAANQGPVGEPMGTPMSRPVSRAGVHVEPGVSFGGTGMTPSGHGTMPSGWHNASHAQLHATASLQPAASYPPTLQGAVNPSLPMPPPAPGSRALVPAALLAGAGLVAGTLWFALRAGPAPAPANQPAATTTAPAAGEKVEPAPPPAAAGSVTLEVEASPPEAKLFLDGKALEKNPFAGSFDRDDRVHVLRAEARGFVSRERELSLQRDARVQFALERDHDRSNGGHARVRPPPPAAPPATAKPNVRQVDDDNPYKKAP
ncbi:MAG TPA: serine/threonine-protein kinase [Polyangiaceae bacterium]|nr:serine/threonine-protein kinase [Polyangiaceae bacterium]